MPRAITVGKRTYVVEIGAHRRFWDRLHRGEWEPETFAIFERYITSRSLFVDIGAWIGPTALYGAQLAQQCIAFEPDPVAFAELRANVAANAGQAWAERIAIHECAINKDGKSFTLGGSAEGADSTSSALFPDRESQWTVRAKRLGDVLAANRKLGQPVFIKVDIEGGEYDLLPAIRDVLADSLVTAYVSFHPAMLLEAASRANKPDRAQEMFVDQHLKAIESLPWSRSIKARDGSRIDKAALLDGIRRQGTFPKEILVSAS